MRAFHHLRATAFSSAIAIVIVIAGCGAPHGQPRTDSEVLAPNQVTDFATLYSDNCSACHGADGKGQAPFMPPLAGNPAVLDGDPSSLINLVLNGADPIVIKGTPDAYRMPQYRVQLNDQQIADALSFVRSGWGNSAGAVTADQVQKLRPVTDPSSDQVIILKMR